MIDLFITAIILACSAILNGLILGLMSINIHELKTKVDLGDSNAIKIYPLRKNGNFLLASLLIGVVVCNTFLSIFIDSKLGSILALITVTVLITIFAELLPLALFSRNQLSLSARYIWLARICSIIFFPFAKLIDLILDKFLGAELPEYRSKNEFARLIVNNHKHQQSDIDKDEARIVSGALSYSDIPVKKVMTAKQFCYTIDSETIIDEDKLNEIVEQGFSRIPVISESNGQVIGIIHSKDLIGVTPGSPAHKLARFKVRTVKEDSLLDDVLNHFIKSRSHLFVVLNDNDEMIGVLTIEDVLEEIIKTEIEDEFDD